jgi:glycosyltransferase involved in cell wall biosynthesis
LWLRNDATGGDAVRILVLTNLYPNPFQPHRAPFNRHQLRLLNCMHPVRVIAPVAWTDELRARWRGAAPLSDERITRFDGITVEHPRYLFPPRLLRRYYGHFYLASVRSAFRRALIEFRPDLAFAPWAYPDGWSAVRLARRHGLPVVVQVHGSDVLLLGQFPTRRARTVEAVRGADGVVAVSRDLAGHLCTLGVEANRVRVVYDGVDRALFYSGLKGEARRRLQLPDEERLVLFIGNLVPVKGLDVLLESVGILAREKLIVRLHVIGQGPLRRSLEQQAERLGLAGQAYFHGALPQQHLPGWYRAADLFVLPSHSEGVPNVLLEASACGTSWVASRVGGIPEIAHLGRSTLVAPNRPAELAQAIRERLCTPLAGELLPAPVPSREEAVNELAAFLQQVVAQHRRQAVRAPDFAEAT